MSQKSSLPQATKSVSRVLKSDNCMDFFDTIPTLEDVAILGDPVDKLADPGRDADVGLPA